MNLDDISKFIKIDPDGMLAEIQGLPDQLALAWKTADKYPLPRNEGFSNVIIAGMGGSAIGADLLASYASQPSVILHIWHPSRVIVLSP